MFGKKKEKPKDKNPICKVCGEEVIIDSENSQWCGLCKKYVHNINCYDNSFSGCKNCIDETNKFLNERDC